MRNLIEFGVDEGINTFVGIDKDYLLLTHLLHLKEHTENITFLQLKEIYLKYIGKNDFDTVIRDDDKPYVLIIDLADNHISSIDTNLENKIVLAIAIRLVAEKFMIDKINDSNFVENIRGVQTRALFNEYKIRFHDYTDNIKILDSVNIMTPENIHLNSFMYEPILDMDIIELKNLYAKIKTLSHGDT